jgi:hypothetical protein
MTARHLHPDEGDEDTLVVEQGGSRLRRVVARLGGLAIVLLIVLMLYTLIHEVNAARREAAQASRQITELSQQLADATADRNAQLSTVQQQNAEIAALVDRLTKLGVRPADLPPGVPGSKATTPPAGSSGAARSGPAPATATSGGGAAGSGGSPPTPGPSPQPPPQPPPCLILNPLTNACLVHL